MGLRDWIRRLERGAREDMDSFELRDGTHYYYDPDEISKALYIHAFNAKGGRDPEPPEIHTMACRAKDPVEVLVQVEGRMMPDKPASTSRPRPNCSTRTR
jgi:hypothetical protein